MEFKTKKAWEAFVDKGISEGKTPQQMNKLAGTYDGPEGRFTVHQKARSNRGWEPVNLAVRTKRGKKRTEAGKAQDQAMLDTLKKGGLSDKEARAILAREKAAYTNVKRIAKRWTQDPDIPGDYQAGHETAALKGGGNYGDNARVEIGKSRVDPNGVIRRGNQSRGMLNEFDDSIKPAMAIPREGRGGEDTALKNLLKIDENPNIMDLGLTPQDRQRMKANPSQANEIIQARQNQIAAIEEAKISGKPISAAKALRIARFAAAGPLSLGLGAASLGLSAQAAWEDPTAHNIEDAAWDTANLTADALSLVPILALPLEGAQKLLSMGHQARIATRGLETLYPTKTQGKVDRFIQGYESEEEISPNLDRVVYEAGGGNAAMTKYGWTIEQTMLQGRKNLELQHLENMEIE